MANGFQQVIIGGQLAADPVMRHTATGTPFTTISIPVDKTWKDKEGDKKSITTWWRITFWGKPAEIINEWKNKGDYLTVVGEPNTDAETGGPRIWTGEDGQARASWEVTGKDFTFGPSAPGSSPADAFGSSAKEEFPF